MWIYDGDRMLINTDWLLTIRAKKEKSMSSVWYRRKTGDDAEDMAEFFLCGYPDFETCKDLVRDLALCMEDGTEIYSIARWTGDVDE